MERRKNELIVLIVAVPTFSVLLWLVGYLFGVSDLSWHWNVFFMNIFYTVLIMALVKASIRQGYLIFQKQSDQKKRLYITTSTYTGYLIIHTIILFIIEPGQNLWLTISVYGLSSVAVLGLIWFYLGKLKPFESPKKQVTNQRHLEVLVKGKSSFIDFEQILAIAVQHKTTFIYLPDGKHATSVKPLTELKATLPEHDFFQVNRQKIVSRHAIAQVIAQENKTLKLELPIKNLEFDVSRARVKLFKMWLKHD